MLSDLPQTATFVLGGGSAVTVNASVSEVSGGDANSRDGYADTTDFEVIVSKRELPEAPRIGDKVEAGNREAVVASVSTTPGDGFWRIRCGTAGVII